MTAIAMLGWLLVGHAVADYPLQSDFMAKGKNWNTPMPGVNWFYIMAAHCLVHAGAVAAITGNGYLACAEFAIHAVLDCLKCAGITNIHHDQFGHVACKALWVYLAMQ